MIRNLLCLSAALLAVCLSALPSRAAKPGNGLWSKLTTVGTLRGRWLTPEQYRTFRTTTEPDDVVGCFSGTQSRTLAAVALQTGFKAFLDARSRPGEAIAVPELNLEVICKVSTRRMAQGALSYQPTFVLRVTRLPPPGPPGGPGAPPPPPAPRP